MNKMIKGSVAGATGIALLMGGFGTYALWSDSTTISDSQVQSGALGIASTGTPVWQDISPGKATSTWSPTGDYMVPGDTVRLDQPITMDVKGRNLGATFTVTGIDPSAATSGTAASPWNNLSVGMSYNGVTLQRIGNTADQQATFTAPAGTVLDGTHHLLVTFKFNSVDNQGATDQNKTLSLENVGIRVDQVRP